MASKRANSNVLILYHLGGGGGYVTYVTHLRSIDSIDDTDSSIGIGIGIDIGTATDGAAAGLLLHARLLRQLAPNEAPESRDRQLIERATAVLPLLQRHFLPPDGLQRLQGALEVGILLHLNEGIAYQRLTVKIFAPVSIGGWLDGGGSWGQRLVA